MKKLKSFILFPMLFVVCTRAAASNTHNTDYKGNVISRSALLKNQFEIVKFLVDKGADVYTIHLDDVMQPWWEKYVRENKLEDLL